MNHIANRECLLVTVVVITYNSAKYILDTLESIKGQTYENLELVISDDCSTDNCVEICFDWIEENKSRFVRTELITVKKNTGIAANGNRGYKAAKGEWVKGIAGDDALLPNCIEDNIKYININQDARVLFSYTKMYLNTFDECNFIRLVPGVFPGNIINETITATEQYNLLLLSDRITFSPSSFIHRHTHMLLGGFDEKMKMQEDYPMWLCFTKAGYKLYFMEKQTVKYRQHAAAVNNMITDYLIKPNYFKTEKFRRFSIYPNLPWDIRWNERFRWFGSQVFRYDGLNKNRKANKMLLALLTSWLNPFKYYIYFKKRFVKNPNN